MKRRAKAVLRRLLVGTLALLVLLGGLLAAALFSETVFRWAVNAAEPLIPGTLQYETLQGTLAGPVHATGVQYTIDGTRIAVGELSFDVSPLALLGNRIRIESLRAGNITVTLPGAGERDDARASAGNWLLRLALPVHLDIPGARLRELALEQADGEVVLALDQLGLSLDWNDRKLAVRDLDAKGPTLTAHGFAVLGLREDVQTDIALDTAWRGQPLAIDGRIEAQGTARQLALNVDLDAPADARLDATLFDLAGTPHWRGTLSINELGLDSLVPSLPATAWSTQLAFEGGWQDTALQGTVSGAWPPINGIDVAVSGKVNAERLLLEDIHGTIGALDASIDAKAELHYADGLRYAARGSLDRLAWPELAGIVLRDAAFDITGDTTSLQGTVQAAAGTASESRLRAEGELVFETLHFDATASGHDLAFTFQDTPIRIPEFDAAGEGVPDDYQLRANARVAVADLPPAQLVATAHGGTQRLVADIKAFEWLNGIASGELQLAWQDALQLDATIHARGFELKQLDRELGATLGGQFALSANFAGDKPSITLDIASLNGQAGGLDIDGAGRIRLADGRFSTRGLTASAGSAHLVLEDAPAGGFDFRLDAAELAHFHAGLAGEIHASGHIEGDLASPSITVNARGSEVSWQDWRAQAVTLDASLQDGGSAPSRLALDASGLATPFIDAGELALDAAGRVGEHRVTLAVNAAGNDGQGELAFAVEGGWQDAQWRGDIETFQFGHPAIGRWSLAEPAADKRIVLGRNAVRFPEHCLASARGHACIGPANGSPGRLALAGRLEAVPVGVLAAWLPAGLDYEGAISGQFRLGPGDSGLEGNLQLQLAPGGIRQVAGEGFETLLGWESGVASVTLDGKTARANLEIELLDEGRITGNGTLALAGPGPKAIDASLQATVHNLQLVPSLVPELSRLRGTATANLDVSGTLAEPRVVGTAKLRDASARVLALGTDWENVDFTLHAEGREITGTGHIESGDGYIDIELDGRDTGEGFTGKARVVGEHFKAMQTPEANIDIAPDLALRLEGRDLYVDGDVFVPMAHIEPRELATATQVSEDQVIVNGERASAAEGVRVHAAVTVRLGDDVRLEGFGLTARLEGRLTVSQEPGSPPVGNGKLIVAEGEYKAYGQDLTLAKGEIIYTGQRITNPGLDIRAERRPNPDTLVGVSVRGPLSNPTTSIYSDPLMSQTAALGLLLFGRTIDDATSAEAEQINEASIALGLGGGKLLRNVGERLGVEELAVQDIGNRERASLVLGKYLSPDLYVSYGIGLFEAVNTIRVRYRISRRWTLEATSGLKSSADFIYTIER